MTGAVELGKVARANPSVALFEISEPGLYVVGVPAGAGAFTLDVRAAGDVNGDAAVDGTDGQALAAADPAAPAAADVDGRGTVDAADQLVLLRNLGFRPGAFDTGARPLAFGLEPGSDSGVRGDDRTAAAAVTLVGTGTPGTVLDLGGRTAVVLPNGMFAFFDVPLALGANDLLVKPADPFAAVAPVSRAVTRLGAEDDPPIVTVGLTTDTGRGDRDRITPDPTVTGTVQDASAIATLEASLDGGVWQSILARKTGTTFTLDTARPTPPANLALPAGAAVPTGPAELTTKANGFTATTAGPADARVKLYANGVPVGEQAGGPAVAFTLANLADGRYVPAAVAEDDAGNRSPFAAPLTVVVDAAAPAAPAFALAPEDVAPGRPAGETGRDEVDRVGTTEPGAVVTRAGTAITATAAADGTFRLADVPLAPGDNALTLTATDRAGNASTVTRTIAVEVPAAGRFAVAAADGTFALEGVPLAAGENAFEYTVTDVAGNTFEAAIRFTREPRPVVALGLAHDTARGGGTDADRVTADPTVAGAVTGAGWAVGLRAGFADVAGPLADVTAALAADGTFTLTPAMLQQLRGGPLAAGTYVLRVAATDTLGRESDPAELVFTLDTAPQIAVAAAVATGAGGRTAYQYTVTNPAANAGLRLGTFYLLVPAGAAPVDVVSPAGWSAEYLADSGLVLWAAGAAAADLPAGGSGVFGFTSPLPAGVIGSPPWRAPRPARPPCPAAPPARPSSRRRPRTSPSCRPAAPAAPAATGSRSPPRTPIRAAGSGSPATGCSRSGRSPTGCSPTTPTRTATRSGSSRRRGPPPPPPPNATPTAGDDFYSTDEDTELVVGDPASGVLAGDGDPDGQPLQAVVTGASQFGATFDVDPATGTFRYDARDALGWLSEGDSVVDQFTYAAFDGAAWAPATVFVTVRGKNDAPEAKDDAGYFVPITRTLRVSARTGLLANDTDPDRYDTLRAGAVTIESQKHARVTIQADGSFDYDPGVSAELRDAAKGNVSITDTFTYEVSDGQGGSKTAAATVTVTGKPPAEYDYEAVATTAGPVTIQGRNSPAVYTGPTQFVSIGRGVSMNNTGWVAFTGVALGPDGRQYANVHAVNTLQPDAPLARLMHDAIMAPAARDPGAPGLAPTQTFGDYVQVNDNGQVLAARALNAVAAFGDVVFGPQMQVPFTFLETWDAATVGAGKTTALVAEGDARINEMGLRLVTLDEFLDPLTGLFRSSPITAGMLLGSFGGLVGMAAGGLGGLAAAALQPPITLIQPFFSGVYPSVLNRNTPFNVVYPSYPGSINNLDPVGTVFNADVNSKLFRLDAAITTWPHAGSPYLGVGLPPGGLTYPRLADTGTTVTTAVGPTGQNSLYALGFDLTSRVVLAGPTPGTPAPDFAAIGQHVGVADDGTLAAFAADHAEQGRGIYVADPEARTWKKVVGVSNDGRLDPNERWVDVNGNGRFDADGMEDVGDVVGIDPDGQVTIAHPAGENSPAGPGVYDTTFYLGFTAKQVPAAGGPAAWGLDVARLSVARAGAAADIRTYTDAVGVEAVACVVEAGQVPPGVGVVSEVSTHDGLDFSGNLTFWAKGDAGSGVIVARPATAGVRLNLFTANPRGGGVGLGAVRRHGHHDERSDRRAEPGDPPVRRQHPVPGRRPGPDGGRDHGTVLGVGGRAAGDERDRDRRPGPQPLPRLPLHRQDGREPVRGRGPGARPVR